MKQAAEQALEQRKNKAREDEQKRIYELVDLMTKVNGVGGIWKTSLEVDGGLARVKQAARGGAKGKLLEALKIQLAFRKKVLKQQLSDQKVWSYSEKGRAFDVNELSRRLKLVIAETPIPSSTLATSQQQQEQEQEQEQQQQQQQQQSHKPYHRLIFTF